MRTKNLYWGDQALVSEDLNVLFSREVTPHGLPELFFVQLKLRADFVVLGNVALAVRAFGAGYDLALMKKPRMTIPGILRFEAKLPY